MKRTKNKIWSSNTLFFLLIILIVLASDYLNTKGDKLLYRKYKLQQDINSLHTKYIEIYTNLCSFKTYGELEKEIKRRHLNLVHDSSVFIIYIDKNKYKKGD